MLFWNVLCSFVTHINELAFSGENAEQTRNSKHNRQNKMSKNN